MTWNTPPATDDQFRAAGYTANARSYPLSEAAARWLATYNGVPVEKIPAAWHYAPNSHMHTWIETKATEQGPEHGTPAEPA